MRIVQYRPLLLPTAIPTHRKSKLQETNSKQVQIINIQNLELKSLRFKKVFGGFFIFANNVLTENIGESCEFH